MYTTLLAADRVHRYEGTSPVREFCDACREARIGLCYGMPVVGKTASARLYAPREESEAPLGPAPYRHGGMLLPDSGPWQTVLCTPGVVNTPRIIEGDIDNLWGSVYGLVARASWHADANTASQSQRPDLVIVDELRPLMPPSGGH